MEDIQDMFEEMAVPEPEVAAGCTCCHSAAVSDEEYEID